ncbi:MAG: DNA polymerase III subunit gamma/tau [Candidatus Cloacimonetes bacterium]|nr:DNA polymerase III subunit gamma/tau [Candidatus Cloacimonadota bacterium]
MSYLVLARKYRPQTFDEVYAQEHITTILKNTIEMDRTAHAYLFTGSRGVGKTSLARIFAKSLNCLTDGPTTTPCNTCQNCIEITQGTSADVIEIDGASNTGVEDIRDLQKELMYATQNSRYKIYIIDEVHMLSKNAFNALLKTLEEPPENVIFIFATTEPHKVLPTIISRCQRFDFKRIPIADVVDRLRSIAKIEGITIAEEALFLVGKKADGSMRDGLSLMDQVLAYGKKDYTYDDILEIFGIVHNDIYHEIIKAIKTHDAALIINHLHAMMEKGTDLQEFINGLLDYIRDLLLLKVGVKIQTLSLAQENLMTSLAKEFSEQDILYLISLLIKAKNDIKISTNPILVAEMSFVKIAKLQDMHALPEILQQIQSGITVTQPTSQPRTPAANHRQTTRIKQEIKQEATAKPPLISQLTTEIYQQHRAQIVEKLRLEKPVLANYFDNCSVQKIQNNFAHFISTTDLANNMLNSNRDLIADIISKHFNIPIKIDFILQKAERKPTIAQPTMEDIKRHSPDLADFIKETDSVFE